MLQPCDIAVLHLGTDGYLLLLELGGDDERDPYTLAVAALIDILLTYTTGIMGRLSPVWQRTGLEYL